MVKRSAQFHHRYSRNAFHLLRKTDYHGRLKSVMNNINTLPKFRVKFCTPKRACLGYNLSITFKEPGVIIIRGGEYSFIGQFPIIESKIKQLYENLVFETAMDSDFKISEICTPDFLQRLEEANDYDTKGYATWLLRSGVQDGDVLHLRSHLSSRARITLWLLAGPTWGTKALQHLLWLNPTARGRLTTPQSPMATIPYNSLKLWKKVTGHFGN